MEMIPKSNKVENLQVIGCGWVAVALAQRPC